MLSVGERSSTDRLQAYVRATVEAGCGIALPALRRAEWPDALHRVRDRHGVDVIALPASALAGDQAEALARFQFAQYLAVGFIDPEVAYRRRLERLDDPDDASVYFIASASGAARLLAVMTLRALPGPPAGARLGDRERPLFEVEEHFGWGVLNRLALLADTPVARVREFGRLVRNAQITAAALRARVVTELMLAATRALLGPLQTGLDACIGEFESTRVQRTLEFFHTPLAVLRGGLPAFAEDHPLNPALAGRARRPFAFWVHELGCMTARVARIEAALERPDGELLAALAALKRVRSPATSCLVPREGVPPLADLDLGQRDVPLPERRQARRRGEALRTIDAFAPLSDTEATALATLLARRTFARGDVLLRAGERPDALTWIERGEAEVRPRRVALTAGACVGAFGALTGARSPVEIVARTPISALTLPRDTYVAVNRGLAAFELAVQRAALAEAAAWV